MRWKYGFQRTLVVVSFFTLIVSATPALGLSSQSANFRIDENSIGTSDALGTSSATYGLTSGLGDLGVGNSTSANFQINAGSKTNPDPVLTVSVDFTGATFGTLSTSSAATTNAQFTVKNYTTYGYAVQLVGPPPTQGSHSLTALNPAGSSSPGTEQFGINLVANTSPITFGANIDNGDFGTGVVDSNYTTPNQFYYEDGDVIATAPGDSGETTYTISYMANIETLTPGGRYKVAQTLVVTGTY